MLPKRAKEIFELRRDPALGLLRATEVNGDDLRWGVKGYRIGRRVGGARIWSFVFASRNPPAPVRSVVPRSFS